MQEHLQHLQHSSEKKGDGENKDHGIEAEACVVKTGKDEVRQQCLLLEVVRRASLLIPIIFVFFFYFNPGLVSDYFIFTLSIFFSVCALVFNFSSVLPSFYKHPIYVGDLVIRIGDSEAEVKLQFQKLFRLLVNIFGSILITAYVDYFYFIYTTRKTFPKTYVEIFATLGGLMGLVSNAQFQCGRILLSFCYFLKSYRHSRLCYSRPRGMSTELINCTKERR
jgi:hypothetical protein